MLEVVQDFDLKDENLSWRRVQKLQLVKLLFIALTFGFSLAVTILVSEDKSFLSKLACSSYKPDFPLGIDSGAARPPSRRRCSGEMLHAEALENRTDICLPK